jgi:hypothetical protein
LVFLHFYFLLECSGITSLPPFPHSSSPHLLNHTSNKCIVTQAFLSELQHTGKQILFFSFVAWDLKSNNLARVLQNSPLKHYNRSGSQ